MKIRSRCNIPIIIILFGSVSCGHFYNADFVEFDEASEVCKESRELVVIESKMIPSDETLDAEAKGRASSAMVVDASQVAETNYKLINEDDEERFVTIPKNRFASVTVPDGRRLVYWIHFVSSDEPTLNEIETEDALHYNKIDAVLLQFHEDGKLQSPGWERELNDTILKEIKTIARFKKISRVYIHLGC